MLQRATLPVLLGCSLVAAAAINRLAGVTVAVIAVVSAAALVVWLLERIIPYRLQWRPTRRALRIDAVHALVSLTVVNPVARLLALALVATLAETSAGGPWPAQLPLVVEVALAIVVADLGAYLAHRAMHRWEPGWRIHAVHHSPRRLYWLASARAHPLNALVTLTAESVPLLWLGVGPEVFLLATVFKAVNGMVQHSNVDVRSAWLSRLLATAECHRWHHAVNERDSNTNFGNTTMLWDQLFGTYRSRRRSVPAVGIDGVEIPESYLAHLRVPWRYPRHRVKRAGSR